MQVSVRENNVDQALRALKKKLQREGVYTKPSRLISGEGFSLVKSLIPLKVGVERQQYHSIALDSCNGPKNSKHASIPH